MIDRKTTGGGGALPELCFLLSVLASILLGWTTIFERGEDGRREE